jgi:hypothetical protein
MSGTDDLNATTKVVGFTAAAGSATALTELATPQTLTANDYFVVVDNSAGAVTINLPAYERSAGLPGAGAEVNSVNNHPIRGNFVYVACTTNPTTNAVTIAATNTTSGAVATFPATTINGSASVVLSGTVAHGVVFLHDGLAWRVVGTL